MTRFDRFFQMALAVTLFLLAAFLLVMVLRVPAHAEGGEAAYVAMALPDLATAPPGAHLHPHVCVTGFVESTRKEQDRDAHVKLCQGRALCLILEIIPQVPLPRPRKGQKIQACGIVRYDGWHSWWEIHPLLQWEVR